MKSLSSEALQLHQRASHYRDYPIELKAAVIAAIEQNGGNVLATSKLFNIPRDTVNYWWMHSERFVEVKHASSEDLAKKLENIAHSTVDSLAEHDLSLVTFADKARGLGVIIDKMQLLRGQPTSITHSVVEQHDLAIILQGALSEAVSGVIEVEVGAEARDNHDA